MSIYLIFSLLVGALLCLDLFVLNKDAHEIKTREAVKWTTLWVSLALAFSGFIYYGYETGFMGLGDTVGIPKSGGEALLEYLTGYLIEQSLSIDNIFVIALIFSYFGIPKKYQHRLLFWGILGAVAFRGLMIWAGALLIERFEWIVYVFGAILLFSAYKMWKSNDDEVDPAKNPVVNFFKKIMPITKSMYGERFFVKRMGITAATPLFIALIVIETTDVIFAFDSIPAIFGITRDPFIVFSSNIFAILGLRSLYFVLAAVIDKFKYLQTSLILILAFVGIKLLLANVYHIPIWASLGVIVLLIAGGVVASLVWQEEATPEKMEGHQKPLDITDPHVPQDIQEKLEDGTPV